MKVAIPSVRVSRINVFEVIAFLDGRVGETDVKGLRTEYRKVDGRCLGIIDAGKGDFGVF